jgi:hypothetical protein
MALIVASTEEKKIFVQGTEIELTGVYMRLEFASRADGVTMEIVGNVHSDKLSYQENKHIPTDIDNRLNGILEVGQVQSVDTAHSLMKANLESKGYLVTLSLKV